MADAAEVNAKHKRQRVHFSMPSTACWPPEKRIPTCLRKDITPGKRRIATLGPEEKPGARRPIIPVSRLVKRHNDKLGNMRKTGVYG